VPTRLPLSAPSLMPFLLATTAVRHTLDMVAALTNAYDTNFCPSARRLPRQKPGETPSPRAFAGRRIDASPVLTVLKSTFLHRHAPRGAQGAAGRDYPHCTRPSLVYEPSI